jgi:translation initiation factor 4A
MAIAEEVKVEGEQALQDTPYDQIESNWDEITDSFDNMNLRDPLLRGIYAYGFEKPSTIQQRAITAICKGRDVIAQAQSGTGKTATYLIGILNSIDVNNPECQALVLVPTHELADQVKTVLRHLSAHLNVTSHCCIGGTFIADDSRILRNGVQIIIGTSGRVRDMIVNRKAVNTKYLNIFVLDEADEMLTEGFQDQIQDIFKNIPPNVQTVLLSATMPRRVFQTAECFMRDPVRILVKADELTLEGIRQYYVNVEREDYKMATLIDIYSTVSVNTAVIFCNTRHKVESLSENLKAQNFAVSSTHGEAGPKDRERILSEFRQGMSRILITTDLLSRGIDVQTVSLVINYDLPSNRESYLHRIGRSGRFGRRGTAINFITEDDKVMLKSIEDFYNTQVSEMPNNIAEMFN